MASDLSPAERAVRLFRGLGRIYVVVAPLALFWLYMVYGMDLVAGEIFSLARPWWVWAPAWVVTLPLIFVFMIVALVRCLESIQLLRSDVGPAVRAYAERTTEDIRAGVTGEDAE